MVFSLLEPGRSIERDGLETNASFVSESSFMTSEQGPNSMLRILLQAFPIVKVGEQKCIEVVQTLARVMAAYFSNLPLYVFSPYCPRPLPPFNFLQEKDRQDWQTSQIVKIDRIKVAKAVREQGLSGVWSASGTLELMLVSGLLAEASLLARNVGDWKHSFFLSVAFHKFEDKRRSVLVTSPSSNTTFHGAPDDLHPEQLILSRLGPLVLNKKQQQAPEIEGNSSETSVLNEKKKTEISDNRRQDSDVDKKLVHELSRTFEASVVAGLDIVPTLLSNLIDELKLRVKSFTWIVPHEFYLPSPPLYCPQPTHSKVQ